MRWVISYTAAPKETWGYENRVAYDKFWHKYIESLPDIMDEVERMFKGANVPIEEFYKLKYWYTPGGASDWGYKNYGGHHFIFVPEEGFDPRAFIHEVGHYVDELVRGQEEKEETTTYENTKELKKLKEPEQSITYFSDPGEQIAFIQEMRYFDSLGWGKDQILDEMVYMYEAPREFFEGLLKQSNKIGGSTMIKWEREAKTPKGFEKVVKELKKNPEVSNPWAIAWSMKNKGIKPSAMNKPISEGDMTGLTSMSAKEDKGEAEFEVEKEKEGVEIEIGMTVASTKEAVAQLKEIASQIEDGYTQGAFVDGKWDLSKEDMGEVEPEAKPEKKEEEPIKEEGSY